MIDFICWILGPPLMLMLKMDEYKIPPNEIGMMIVAQLVYWAFFYLIWIWTK